MQHLAFFAIAGVEGLTPTRIQRGNGNGLLGSFVVPFVDNAKVRHSFLNASLLRTFFEPNSKFSRKVYTFESRYFAVSKAPQIIPLQAACKPFPFAGD